MATNLLISTRKGLIRYQKKSGQWKFSDLHFNGIPVSLSYHDPNTGFIYAFLDHGHWGMKIQRSEDLGQTWKELAAPVYPEGAEAKEGVSATLRYIWAAHHGGSDHPGRLWIGTEPGGLFKSEDNGESWSLNTALWNHPSRKTEWTGGGRDFPGIHSIVMDQQNSDHFYVGISCAGVFETTDGGESFNVRNKGLRADFLPDPFAEIGHDPHMLVACQNDQKYMWQQNHCGIFKSENGGIDWQDVSEKDGPANFGFAMAVKEDNPHVAWVAPGVSDEIRVAVDHALCISRTDDGGKTWQDFRSGLPQENCFDIVYRHSLQARKDELVFGTTTGNLYHSNDGGEHWQTISNNLPMVYAVEMVDA